MVERKQLHVQVITAKKQSKKLMSDFQEMMNKKTNSEIILEEKVDPSILGGAIIQYGSHKFDTSVKSKLEDLNNLLERFS
jgi:F-type H+-transporting ATPase subunit delta